MSHSIYTTLVVLYDKYDPDKPGSEKAQLTRQIVVGDTYNEIKDLATKKSVGSIKNHIDNLPIIDPGTGAITGDLDFEDTDNPKYNRWLEMSIGSDRPKSSPTFMIQLWRFTDEDRNFYQYTALLVPYTSMLISQPEIASI